MRLLFARGIAAGLAALVFSACGAQSGARLDSFSMEKGAPLIRPQEYRLTEPRVLYRQLQARQQRQQPIVAAQRAILGAGAVPAATAVSASDRRFLQLAGVSAAHRDERYLALLEYQFQLDVELPLSFIFGRYTPVYVLNPVAEAERVRANQESGLSAVDGASEIYNPPFLVQSQIRSAIEEARALAAGFK